MIVSRCMTTDVRTISPERSIREAARAMSDMDVGALPVGESGRLLGMITDRDIAVRAVCEGKGPETSIREVMSEKILYCYDDEELDDVVRNMGDFQVRRLPVLNRDKRLVGILSLGDVASAATEPETVGQVLGEISRQGGLHSQSRN